MLEIAAAILLTASSPCLQEEIVDETEISELEWIFEGEEIDLQSEEVVFDDSLLHSDSLELEE